MSSTDTGIETKTSTNDSSNNQKSAQSSQPTKSDEDSPIKKTEVELNSCVGNFVAQITNAFTQ